MAPSAASSARAKPRLIGLDEALQAKRSDVVRWHETHLNPRMMKVYEFIGLDHLPARARGAHFWDKNGLRYLDFLSAFGTLILGHNPPKLIEAVQKVQAAGIPNFVEGPHSLAGALASNLAAIAPRGLTRVYLGSAGTEATDAALKFARSATGRAQIVAVRRAYHGRSVAALSLMDRKEYRERFEPMLAGVSFIEMGDTGALASLLNKKTAAGFIVEPIQGEGGMIPAPADFLREARELCSQTGTMLIFDEIQCGLGRAGTMFAADFDGVVPDCLLVGKGLGGGVMPLSALLTTDKLWFQAKGNTPQSPFHVSTYSGNSYACAAGIACIEQIMAEDLPGRAVESGAYLRDRLLDLQRRQPLIEQVRGRGLMLGVKLTAPGILRTFKGSDVRYLLTGLVLRNLITKRQVVTAVTLNDLDVLRVQPPLNVEREQLDQFVDSLEHTLLHTANFVKTVLKSSRGIVRFLGSQSVATSYE